jgi:hypothetical protein
MASYRFVDRWLLAAEPRQIYDVLSQPRSYPVWWGDVFLKASGDGGEAAPGKRVSVVTRGFLPYRLRWELECVEAAAPERLVSALRGDLVGSGIWTIEPVEGGSRATLEWLIEVRKPLVRHLTPVLRGVFAWNHRWAMRRGERYLRDLLATRAVPPDTP